MGYDPGTGRGRWPTPATEARRRVLRFVQWHLGASVGRVSEAVGIHRSKLPGILAILAGKALVRRLGPARAPVYYPTRLGGQPFDAAAHYARHAAPYGYLVRLLDRLGETTDWELARALGWPRPKVRTLLDAARRDGVLDLVTDEEPRFRPRPA